MVRHIGKSPSESQTGCVVKVGRSKGDMVSASEICFSTLSFERRSRRRRQMSSVVLGVGAIYTDVSTTRIS
jgi:hypothetical protein